MKSTLQVKHRDRLYFDQYEYCARFQQAEISCIRGLDILRIRKSIDYRKSWAGNPLSSSSRVWTSNIESNLYETFNFLSSAPASVKITFSWHWCYVYSNNLAWLQRIDQECAGANLVSIHQAVIDRPRNTVSLLEPKFAWRTYFRERTIDPDVKQRLKSWIQAQNGEVSASPAMNSWLTYHNDFSRWRSKCLQRYYYVEHNDPRFDTMLAMVMPGMIRTTVPIQQRAK